MCFILFSGFILCAKWPGKSTKGSWKIGRGKGMIASVIYIETWQLIRCLGSLSVFLLKCVDTNDFPVYHLSWRKYNCSSQFILQIKLEKKWFLMFPNEKCNCMNIYLYMKRVFLFNVRLIFAKWRLRVNFLSI